VGALASLSNDAQLGRDALFALALAPGEAALAELTKKLSQARPGSPGERTLLRAALLRAQRWGARVPGLEARLERALASSDPEARAVGAYGLALLGGAARRGALMLSEDPVVVIAAARASQQVLPPAVRLRFMRAATGKSEQVSDIALALSAALLQPVPELSAAKLARWVEAGGPIAPLAAFRLAARDAPPFRSRLRAWLAGTDPLIRSHIAYGLGLSPEPTAVSLLHEAYRFEPRADVRRAIVRGLSLRGESLRRDTLRLARELDPDPEVRALATAALAGVKLDSRIATSGHASIWVKLAGARGRRAAQLVRADGLVRLVLSDPDGEIMVAGLRAGHAHALWLAPDAQARKRGR
jgi:hypothetical protein